MKCRYVQRGFPRKLLCYQLNRSISESWIHIADVGEKDNSCFGMPFGTSCNQNLGYCDNNICINFSIPLDQNSKITVSVLAYIIICFEIDIYDA